MDQIKNEKLNDLISKLWDESETAFKEFNSSKLMAEFLENEGFQVTKEICDMETAFVAQYGSGKPVICILAEYDALYGLSQEADVAQYKPIKDKDTGHGCGHHLLGVGSIGAAMIIKEAMDNKEITGTIKMVGCPAEEAGSGKAYLARDGFFDDADIAITWHPSTINTVSTGSNQSCISCFFRFHGVSSHAAGSPHLGRSALDAGELMSVGVNYLREHMESSDRVHYAYTNVGGKSPNVVQAECELNYFIRSTTNPKAVRLFERVKDIARGAALMTGTTCEIVFDEGLSNVIPNFTLEQELVKSFKKIGVNQYTSEERAYASKFKETFDLNDAIAEIDETVKDKKDLIQNMLDSEICDIFVEHIPSEVCNMGSTDVGDVSWVIPTAQINTACYSYGANAHSWQWVAQGKSAIALKGVALAAEVMADTIKECFNDPSIIEKAKLELNERLGKDTYECLIPKEVKPHLF